jgi:heterodisulfide reductase subunit C
MSFQRSRIPREERKVAKKIEVKKKAVDPKFKNEVAARPGGENLKRCYACGTCTLSCPISEVEEAYSPRRIIHMILLGLREEVLSAPTIWHCLTCYRCHVRCPQQVKYPEIMRILRNMAVEEGYVKPEFVKELQRIDRVTQENREKMLNELVSKVFKKAQDG